MFERRRSVPLTGGRVVVWIGQSVFVVPEPDADELAEKLRGLGAIVTMAPVAVDSVRFEEFRRRALARRPA